MLNFEKVLGVFKEYLDGEDMYEIVMTSHGYTLMGWNAPRKEWHTAKYLETPEIMLEALLETYADYLADELTESDRDITPAEQAEISTKCQHLRTLCQSE